MSDAPASSAVCPACGGAHDPDAVFCPRCDKALGEFPYVGETLAASRCSDRPLALADRVTAAACRPHFLTVHAALFALWILLNTGAATMIAVRRWDPYPYNLLGIVLAVESLFLSGFVLISQGRQDAFAAEEARLDYEVNVRAYRELRRSRALFAEALQRLRRLEEREGYRGHHDRRD